MIRYSLLLLSVACASNQSAPLQSAVTTSQASMLEDNDEDESPMAASATEPMLTTVETSVPGVPGTGNGFWCYTKPTSGVRECYRQESRCDERRESHTPLPDPCQQQDRAVCLYLVDQNVMVAAWLCFTDMPNCESARQRNIKIRAEYRTYHTCQYMSRLPHRDSGLGAVPLANRASRASSARFMLSASPTNYR